MATQFPVRKKPAAPIRRDTMESIKDFGVGGVDPLLEYPDYEGIQNAPFGYEGKISPPKRKKEANLFNYNAYHEREVVKQEIRHLTEQVKHELEVFKKSEANLLNEVKDIQKLSVDSLPEKPGIYHVRFLELIISVLRTLRLKVNESRTWLQAFISKKKKRGSLFASLSKKKGTQYSLSQELSSSRSIQ